MSDEKGWYSFLIPGLGWLDAWVSPEAVNEDARWIEVENLTRVQIAVGPDGKPRGAQIEKMFERTSFNLGLALVFERTNPDKIKMLSEAWGKIIRGSVLDFPADGKRRLPHD